MSKQDDGGLVGSTVGNVDSDDVVDGENSSVTSNVDKDGKEEQDDYGDDDDDEVSDSDSDESGGDDEDHGGDGSSEPSPIDAPMSDLNMGTSNDKDDDDNKNAL